MNGAEPRGAWAQGSICNLKFDQNPRASHARVVVMADGILFTVSEPGEHKTLAMNVGDMRDLAQFLLEGVAVLERRAIGYPEAQKSERVSPEGVPAMNFYGKPVEMPVGPMSPEAWGTIAGEPVHINTDEVPD